MRLKTFLKEQEVEFSTGGEDSAEMSAVEANPEAVEAGSQMQQIRTIIRQGIDEIGAAMADGQQEYDEDLTDAIVDGMVADIADLFVDAPAPEASGDEDMGEEEPAETAQSVS